MTSSTLAPTPDSFAQSTWPDIEPRYRELVEQELDPADTSGIEAWLDQWNALDTALGEAMQVANVDASCDTANPVKEEAYLRFARDIMPLVREQGVLLAAKLIATGYTRPDLETTLRRFRTDREIFREENIPLQQELQGLNVRYNKLTGGMMVEWDGKQVPLPRLNPFMHDQDPAIRERAWRLQFQPYTANRDDLADIFDGQLKLRQQVAANAGFANYRDYVFADKYRYDYTPENCATFHESVSATFVPAVGRRLKRRQDQMKLDSVRPWDTEPDPLGRTALKPYDSIEQLNAMSETVFNKVDPAFGQYFATMRKEDLLDLESRQGKRPGGFCTTFPYRKRPFIFMNASGVANDVRTLLHEAGHAFHGFEASTLPFIHSRHPGSEMAEVASMSMELLASPYLNKANGGLYDEDEYRRARIEHLDGVLAIFGWVATVDAFQQWLYTDSASSDRDARDKAFVETWSRFNPGLDWTGLDAERTARWYKQLHIFLYPFYYIEYAIAQLGALQVWRNARKDQTQATANYRAALALGGSRPLPELFAAAGARLIFDAAGMAELVGLIEEQLAVLGE